MEAKIASKSLYNPLGFDLKSADESLDELPLLLGFQNPLHLTRLVDGSLVVTLLSLLKLDFASSLNCLVNGLSVPELLLPELRFLSQDEVTSPVSFSTRSNSADPLSSFLINL